jgi:acetolactate synthase-1/2/3 large subunit
MAFGLPGGTISPFFDALGAVPQIRCVATRHETTAVFAAIGHARATGKPALVFTTSGPGITNALTGIAAAYLEELPLIVVGGEVPTHAVGRGAIQDGSVSGLSCESMLRSITHWCGTLTATNSAGSVAERAYQLATQGRRPGPVFVSAPLNVSAGEATLSQLAVSSMGAEIPDAEACRQAARLLEQATRPLMILGNGARRAAQEALRLADRLGLPTVVTGHAKGIFPERHPLYVGILGIGQHPSVAEYLVEPPDVTLIVGSRLNDLATNGWSVGIGGSEATIQIDRDPWLLGRNVDVTLGLVGDAASTLTGIHDELPKVVCARSRDVPACRSFFPEREASEATPLKPQRVLRDLSRTFPDAVWCSDIGEHLSHALHYLRIDEPDRFHVLLGLGSMGSGVGLAIGMKQAMPGETVIGLCGDGGFTVQTAELLTCVENGIDVLFAVFNDGRWNMVNHGFQCVYGRTPDFLPDRVADLSMIAKACGAIGVVVSRPSDLSSQTLREYASAGRPVVLDIRIDANEALTQDTRSASLKHFRSSGQ